MKFSVAGLSAVCLIGLYSCGSSSKPAEAPKAPPPVPVAFYVVQKGAATYYDQYPATVVALNEVQLRPQTTGYVTGVYFKDGQHVTKGQKLYSIDQQQYQASYNQALANLNVASANLGKAQQDADRYAELLKKDAIARQTAEHAQADLQASKMQLEAAKAGVASAQTSVKYSTIYSPFDGTIGISQVKMGTAVSPGQTVLNTVSTDNPIAVDVAVDQKEISRFLELQKSGNGVKDSVFTLMLPSQDLYPYPGQIAFIDRAVDPQTGTIKARLSFPNKEKLLKAGMSVNVRVKNNGNTQTLLIPYKAVMEQMGEYFVYVVGDSNKVAQHKIQAGQVIGDKLMVKGGLNENDKIVTEGVQKLREGAVVQLAKDSATFVKDSAAASRTKTDTGAAKPKK